MRLMKQDSAEQLGFTVWQAQLQAILRTSRGLTLTKLAAMPDLIPTLTAMLKAAEQDQQVLLLLGLNACAMHLLQGGFCMLMLAYLCLTSLSIVVPSQPHAQSCRARPASTAVAWTEGLCKASAAKRLHMLMLA